MPVPNQDRINLHVDLPKDAQLPEVLRSIAIALDEEPEDSTGYARVLGFEEAHWRISRPGEGVPIDPRQREAAAMLIMAFDLPADLMLTCMNMFEAAAVNPGMTTTGMSGRVAALREAKRLIDEMLAETA